ncbi:rhomboid protease GluP [Salsuginibacillus halophilus]|uniref:Rhomboid protease GluP n=1 Tax=Salsuginibacillus halophilus TaxID=517424 RepID=A0A2P8H7X3_9BACI|nr:rhomboid family intramembrane serine protease [Salsuginibacillus halophilus]PSL42322.1 rhomboid protease GluP [Salsuginibacillus halophilus]
MEIERQNRLFWEFVYHFVVNRGLRIVSASKDKKKLWLENDDVKNPLIIRLSRVDVDWSRELENDQETMAKEFVKVRAKVPVRKPKMVNVYVTVYPTIDDHARVLADENGPAARLGVQNFLVPGSGPEWQAPAKPEDVLEHLSLKAGWEEQTPVREDLETQELYQQAMNQAEAKQKEEQAVFLYSKPKLTLILMGLIAVMYGLLEATGGSQHILTLVEYGAKYNPAIADGEWWRLITSMFLHIGFFHFFMNSLALFFIGGLVERIFGTWRFMIIYFAAGIVGSAASFALNIQISAGASGAIFGCFGALLFFGMMHRKLFFRTMGVSVIVILLINLGFGFVVPMVDNGAHIGGLIGGLLAAMLVGMPKSGTKFPRLLPAGLLVALFVGLFWYGNFVEEDREGGVMQAQMAQEMAQEGDIGQAEETLAPVLDQENPPAEALFVQGNLEAETGDYETARTYFEQTLDRRADFHEAHYNLALVLHELGEDEEALNHVEEALQIEPGEERYEDLREEISGS